MTEIDQYEEQHEQNGIIEPDITEPVYEEPKKSGCGCQKNKEQNLEITQGSSPCNKRKNQTLFIVLGVIVMGTFLYYIMKRKQVITE